MSTRVATVAVSSGNRRCVKRHIKREKRMKIKVHGVERGRANVYSGESLNWKVSGGFLYIFDGEKEIGLHNQGMWASVEFDGESDNGNGVVGIL